MAPELSLMKDFTTSSMEANRCFIDEHGILNVLMAGPRNDANNIIVLEQILKAVDFLRPEGKKVLVYIDISKMEVAREKSSGLKLREIYNRLRSISPDKMAYVGTTGWASSALELITDIENTFKLFDDKKSAVKWLLS